MKYCIPEVQETPNLGIGAAPEPRVQQAATTRSPGCNTLNQNWGKTYIPWQGQDAVVGVQVDVAGEQQA